MEINFGRKSGLVAIKPKLILLNQFFYFRYQQDSPSILEEENEENFKFSNHYDVNVYICCL